MFKHNTPCTPSGLQHFLKAQAETFLIILYTMGDEDYVKAVLAVIDPHNQLFTGETQVGVGDGGVGEYPRASILSINSTMPDPTRRRDRISNRSTNLLF
jgi:hypothetical protein